jgi:hypothetical protein
MIRDWIDLARDWDKWRAVVDTIINFGLHTKCEKLFD